ncbi:MAG: hypothetical protein ABEK59_03100 [Halobacteria archaeon]
MHTKCPNCDKRTNVKYVVEEMELSPNPYRATCSSCGYVLDEVSENINAARAVTGGERKR